jgi:hypothetical protein
MGRIIRDFGGEGVARIAQPNKANIDLPEELMGVKTRSLERVRALKAARPLPHNYELTVLAQVRESDKIAIDAAKRLFSDRQNDTLD